MGDSDDDYDRRNTREKFRHERNDYDRKGDRSREKPSGYDRSRYDRSRDRGGYRNYRHSSPPSRREASPHAKRMRRDDGHPPPPRYGPMHGAPPPHWGPPGPPQGLPELDFPTQPPMMSFKNFLMSPEAAHGASEEENVRRYNEYKMEFKRQQINEFFLQHKDEEWFRSKYHPDEYEKNYKRTREALGKRRDVYMKLLELNALDGISVDYDKTTQLIKLIDKAVILMEGGTESDFPALDREIMSESVATSSGITPTPTKRESGSKKKNGGRHRSGSSSNSSSGSSSGSSSSDSSSDDESLVKKDVKTDNKKKRRHNSDSDSCSSSSDEDDDDLAKDKSNEKKNKPLSAAPDTEKPAGESNAGVTNADGATVEQTSGPTEGGANAENSGTEPRPLHITQSIFLRNLAPTITQQEVEALCRKYDGFMRAALQDPQPERRFARRGWVTFNRLCNVKDICFALNNIRLRDCDMGAIVNRELRQRIRVVNGLTVHHQVMKQDIKHAAKIVQNFDTRWRMWDQDLEKGDEEKEKVTMASGNPLVKNITDYLVDEGNYEEEALLGCGGADKPQESNPAITIEKDEKILQVLDRLILYLRIVYSFDYYSAVEYPNEDDMPHRCGIMHARGVNQSTTIYQSDVDNWIKSFETKIMPFVSMKIFLDDTETIKLGRKSQDTEVEKFIMANTQELAKDKWLCPLSGKKFKGPEFIRKHIQSKHGEKIEEVKKEVVYFNNYLKDSRRPQLPEHPSTRHMIPPPTPRSETSRPPTSSGYSVVSPPPPTHPGAAIGGGFYRHPAPPHMYPGMPPYGGLPPYGGGVRGPPDPYNRGNQPPPPPQQREQQNRPREKFMKRDRITRPDPRRVISYKDLDAPADDDDIF